MKLNSEILEKDKQIRRLRKKNKVMYEEGKDLKNVISPKLNSRLQRIFDWLKENTEIDVGAGVSNSWKNFRPEFIIKHYLQQFSTQMFSSLVDRDFSDIFCDLGAIATVIPENTTLDMFLAFYAKLLNKKIGDVENVEIIVYSMQTYLMKLEAIC